MNAPLEANDGPVVAFREVTRRFGSRLAVEGVDLELRSGTTLGLVGESGSGKTTCVRMVLGLLRPSSGTLLLRGRPYPRSRRELRAFRRHIGSVFQDPYDALDPRMTIGAIVAEPLRAHGLGGRDEPVKIEAMLAAVGLPDAPLDSYPSRYSGGGRQRIAIARGLILEPDVLVCDEPTASLDVSVQAQILNLLLDLKRQRGVSTIFVSHDLDLVRRIADDIAVMHQGRVVESGPTEEVSERPRHPYTEMLLSAVPGDHPRRRKLEGRAATATDEEPSREGCLFAARCHRVQDVCRTTRPPLEEGPTAAACLYPLEPVDRPQA